MQGPFYGAFATGVFFLLRTFISEPLLDLLPRFLQGSRLRPWGGTFHVRQVPSFANVPLALPSADPIEVISRCCCSGFVDRVAIAVSRVLPSVVFSIATQWHFLMVNHPAALPPGSSIFQHLLRLSAASCQLHHPPEYCGNLLARQFELQ